MNVIILLAVIWAPTIFGLPVELHVRILKFDPSLQSVDINISGCEFSFAPNL